MSVHPAARVKRNWNMDKIIIWIAVVTALSGWSYDISFAEATQKADNLFCLDCHANPDL
jgi:hypothetical protein